MGGLGNGRGRRARLAGLGVLALVGLVFVVQNRTGTEIRLLWWSLRMPLVFVLVAMIALGVGLDRLWVWLRSRK
jgi:uncharacterized integral membrane protein